MSAQQQRTPAISVIVTAYNIERYIRECVTSIVEQTLEDIEIIVVDDGSTDGTPVIIKELAESDDRIVPVLLTENTVGGVATAANAGLDAATAPYVGFADGDDVYEITMFEKLLNAAVANDSDLAMCDYLLLDELTGELLPPADSLRWEHLTRPWYRLDVQQQKRFLQFVSVPWRKIYRRSMLEAGSIRFPVGDYFYEDNPFHWFTLLSARDIAVVPEVLCHHRVAREGQTMNTADQRLFKMFEHHETIHAWLCERGLHREFGPTLYNWALSQLEWISERTPKPLRKELFDIVRPVLAHYDQNQIERAANEMNKGSRSRLLAAAVMKGNFAAFNRTLDREQSGNNPVVSAWYHMRYSGVRQTARIAKRYLAQRREPMRLRRRSRSNGAELTTDDLMFALMIIEQRLDRIEEVVSKLDRGEAD